ncbi:hypothetical protein C0Q70_14529 [Pomacea canaliculata]|uniref:ShKT domain-containing protein n=1 Tax=Pomacea canaliculata TaxID=400727 RepID=A0A2T7NSA1_POMCA|nr:hypothetical protein C0Q70_14529 [Pomacea canaliculata]
MLLQQTDDNNDVTTDRQTTITMLVLHGVTDRQTTITIYYKSGHPADTQHLPSTLPEDLQTVDRQETRLPTKHPPAIADLLFVLVDCFILRSPNMAASCLSLFVLVTVVMAQSVIGLDQAMKDYILGVHNKYRGGEGASNMHSLALGGRMGGLQLDFQLSSRSRPKLRTVTRLIAKTFHATWGNWNGEKPFEKGPACSGCSGGTCEANLCVGASDDSSAGKPCEDTNPPAPPGPPTPVCQQPRVHEEQLRQVLRHLWRYYKSGHPADTQQLPSTLPEDLQTVDRQETRLPTKHPPAIADLLFVLVDCFILRSPNMAASCLSLFVLVTVVMAQSVIGLDQAMKDYILGVHNKYRGGQGASNMHLLTRRVGCASRLCTPLANAYNKAWYLVCFYDPKGNWNGEKPFEKGPACSGCSGGTCEANLCVGEHLHLHQQPKFSFWNCKPCEDTNPSCSTWASNNQCVSNPVYMKSNCAKSCGICGEKPGCQDQSPQCAEWAKRGECASNPAYMNTSCAKSCGKC